MERIDFPQEGCYTEFMKTYQIVKTCCCKTQDG